MNPWLWVPIGFAAWAFASVIVGLLIGPVLKRSRETAEAIARQQEGP